MRRGSFWSSAPIVWFQLVMRAVSNAKVLLATDQSIYPIWPWPPFHCHTLTGHFNHSPYIMYLQNKPKIVCSRESFQEVYHFIEGSVPFLDMVVDHALLEEDSIKVIHAVFPKWAGDELEFTQCKDGITNKCNPRLGGYVANYRT